MERRRHPAPRWCNKSLHGLTSTNRDRDKNPPFPYHEPRKRRSNPGIPLANGLRTHYSLERRNPGQTVSTSGNIKYSARRYASSGRHDRRRVERNKSRGRKTALCNTPQNYDSIGVGSKGYGQDKEDLQTNGPGRISKARTDIQRKRVAAIPTRKTMGPRYRAPTRRSKGIRLQNIPYDERRRRIAEGIHRRTIKEGVYTTIKIPIRITLFLYQEKRREAQAGARLPQT